MKETKDFNLPDITLNPEIEANENEIIEAIYKKLYQQFFEAQIPKSPQFPHGIEEGDRLDISLKNSAFGFAKTVGEAIEVGASGGEIDVSNLVQKDGDTMTGELAAIRGFKAGKNGQTVLEIKTNDGGVHYVDIASILNVTGDGLTFDGHNSISRNTPEKTTTIKDSKVVVESDEFSVSGGASIGGISIGKDGVIKDKDGNEFYSPKNSNKKDVSWTTNNLDVWGDANIGGSVSVDKDITVSGSSNLSKNVKITKDKFDVLSDAHFNGDLYVGEYILAKKVDGGITIGASNGNLIIGNDSTKEVRLAKPIKTWDGKYSIITESGFGNFQGGFSASHNRSSPIIKTFYNSDADKGVVIDNIIRFSGSKDVYLREMDGAVMLGVDGSYMKAFVGKSTSFYKPLNRESKTFFIDTDSDFLVVKQPVESESFTIKDKSTQLKDKMLNFGDGAVIEAGKDRMTLHSNIIIKNNISSEKFADGFSGYGWAIKSDAITGITRMTVDELTVRNKMNLYELNVRKIKSSNGAIWVSDNMVGESVKQII